MPDLRDRISGGLIGLLVGDALGVPYEFNSPENLPDTDRIEFDPPPGFQRSHRSVPPGTWSDDGAQALCLLASLLYHDRFEPADFANRLINWYEVGYLAVDGHVFDVGNQTREAIGRLQSGVPPLEAGGDHTYSQGNGSLMRVLPLALWHRGSDAELVRDAHDQSRVTHGHITVQVCCALYCLWARRVLEDDFAPWQSALTALRSLYGDWPDHLAALDDDVLPWRERTPRGSGFVVDCLFSAKEALRAGPYETVVKAAVALGDDTDTTACVAGGIAGLRDGVGAIPARWREQLRGMDDLRPLHEALLDRFR